MQEKEIENLLKQESFLNYCFKRNDDDVRYWEKWLMENPNHTLEIESIKRMLILVAEESRNAVKQDHLSELEERIAKSKSPEVFKKPISWPRIEKQSPVQIAWPVWRRIAVAASIVLCLSLGGYFLLPEHEFQFTHSHKNDIAPGGNKAVLTLSNGQKISLTGAKNGQLALQGNMVITKKENGEVAYNDAKSLTTSSKVVFNTMTTPRGGQYQLTLSDGTHVWLNAASSIRYPSSFIAGDREVEITGEAYFEVAHNPNKPFRVISGDQAVVVLGTHFNINAYHDEADTKTTLLEGKVKVTKNDQQIYLKPGEQALNSNKNASVVIKENVNTAIETAWKNGDFIYHNEDLVTIMRQLSRWYNVEVSFTDNVGKLRFGGMVSRSQPISAVLNIMETTGKIHFNIEGRRITVTAGTK